MARTLTLGVSIYWFMFWFMNAWDKILCGKDLGLLKWSGRDRMGQFEGYLQKLNLPVHWCEAIISFAFVVELVVAVTFFHAVVMLIKRRNFVHFMPQELLKVPIFLSMMVFTGFSAFDVVVGDRAELLEHGTYICALGVTWIIASFESVLDVVPKRTYGGEERRATDLTDRRAPAGIA